MTALPRDYRMDRNKENRPLDLTNNLTKMVLLQGVLLAR